MLLQRFEQTWEVEPTGSRARLTLRFDGKVKLGIIGRMLVAGIGRGGRLENILRSYEQELTTDV